MVDCGVYLNEQCVGDHQTGKVTLLLDKQIVSLMDGGSQPKDQLEEEIMKIIEVGVQGGLEVDSPLRFYSNWQKKTKLKK